MTPTVGHVVREYLPRSATFIHTTLRFQTAARPVVLAGRVTHAEEFPFAPVVELTPPDAPAPRRALRRLRARAAGMDSAFEHRLVTEARRHGCALLHAHFGHVAWMALDARARLGIPLVATFYGHDVGMGRDAPWAERYTRLFAEAAAVCVEGPAMGESVARLGCPPERIELVPIGVDTTLIPFAPAPRNGRLTIVQTGRMVEKKGFDTALRAFAAARPRLGDAELVLIGDGPLREAHEMLAAELALGDSVRFMGSLRHDAYREALRGAHVGLQTSRTAADGDTEGGAPTVLLELQASGVPIVATRHADIPAVVAGDDALADEQDVAGLADALVAVAAEDAAERRARLERGRAFVEDHHDARRVAERLVAVYERVLAT